MRLVDNILTLTHGGSGYNRPIAQQEDLAEENRNTTAHIRKIGSKFILSITEKKTKECKTAIHLVGINHKHTKENQPQVGVSIQWSI